MHSLVLSSLLASLSFTLVHAQNRTASIYPTVELESVYINDTLGIRPVSYFISSNKIAIVDGDQAYGTEDEFRSVIIQPTEQDIHTLSKRSAELDATTETLKRRKLTGRGGKAVLESLWKRANTIWPNGATFDNPEHTEFTQMVWPENTVKYKYYDTAAESLAPIIDASIKRWTDVVPCLTFKKEPTSSAWSADIVTIFQDADMNGNFLCYASVGAKPGNPFSKVLSPCGVNEATHEWGHVIGFHHEHKRHDRDLFTRFHCDRLHDYDATKPQCCQESTCCGSACQFTRFFNTFTNFKGLENGGAYDIESLMHYRRDGFARFSGLDVLSRGHDFNPGFPSTGDIARANELYAGTSCGVKPTVCPKACNVHNNNCHFPSAQTCIYPNPFSPNPKAACACAPGYKSAYPNTATDKHWRLPIVGQEHRVWVAEGVECSTLCQGYGVDSCKEVTILGPECA